MKIAVINGPNLNLLGKRAPELYGHETFEATIADLKAEFEDSDIDIEYFQSNHEGVLIDKLHEIGFDKEYCGIVFNPGAYAHYSYAIADAVEAIELPVVEVHISDIQNREAFRRTSVTARCAKALIAGMGRKGYSLAIHRLLNHAQ